MNVQTINSFVVHSIFYKPPCIIDKYLGTFLYCYILDKKQSINMEASSALRRTLLGYRLEINFEECIFLSPSVTSYVYKFPRPGQTYEFMLSAVTCASENAKEHRAKVKLSVLKFLFFI